MKEMAMSISNMQDTWINMLKLSRKCQGKEMAMSIWDVQDTWIDMLKLSPLMENLHKDVKESSQPYFDQFPTV